MVSYVTEVTNHLIVIQRFGGGYILRLITSRGDQLRSNRCLSRKEALHVANLWSADHGNCRIDDRTWRTNSAADRS
jgi:hypothetical protein